VNDEEVRDMSDDGDLRAKREVLAVLRRAALPESTVQALDAALVDPVDLRRDGDLLSRHGISLDGLIDRMGGSP
jgi:hypothetical protein